MRQTIILWSFLAAAASAWSQPCGLEDTLYINPNSIHTFNFEVFNIYNDDLSAPDQGICGIEIEFSHNYVEDMLLSVTSPGGQMVTLTGPNSDDPVAFTNFTRWRITFVPDAETPMPDFGFLPTWNNNQPNNWGVFGLYTGTYHPYQGSLEDFDAGPVNGTWTINVINNPSAQIGAILGFRLLFCDERGLDCCFAAAGNLDTFENILACQGDSSLALSLPPDYSGTPPDTNEYGYTYLIGQDSILLAYDSIVNLTGFVPGLYQVCGLSYKRIDYDSFPAPDGQLTIDSIRRNLSSLEPGFCGEVTDSCLWVRIVPPPDTTFLAGSICEGDSVMVGDSVLAVTGSYDISLQSYAGCDSIVHYDLNVIPTRYTALADTICQGDSVVVGTTAYTVSGTYTDTLQATTSCDSIVSLDLTVVPPAIVDTTVVLCQGEGFPVGDSLLTATGNYTVILASSLGCDSIVNVSLQVLDVAAAIASPDTITCSAPAITLDGSGSSPAGNISYTWLDTGGAILGTSPTLAANTPGTYILEVAQALNAVQCLSRDTVVVEADTISPVADAGLTDTLTCEVGQLVIGGPNTSAGPEFQYNWSAIGNGNFIGPANNITAAVDAAGQYRLIVANTRNGCRDTASVLIRLDERSPVAATGPDTTLTCARTSLLLSGAGSSTGPVFEYDWQATNGAVPQDAGTLTPLVSVAGDYRLLVTNTDNGCQDSAFVLVTYDTLSSIASIAAPAILNCATTSIQLEGAVVYADPAPIITWTAGNGGNIAAGANSLMPVVDAPGTYQLFVENSRNGCRDSASVTVLQNISIVSADAGAGGQLTCTDDTLTLDGSASTAAPDLLYCWSTTGGHFTADSLGMLVDVNAPGDYRLIVKDTVTFCADTAFVTITQDTVAPVSDSGPDRLLTCDSTSATLDGTGSSANGNYDYVWIAVNGLTPVAADTLTPAVSEPGSYLLVVTDRDNGCIDTSLVDVGIDTIRPVVAIAEPGALNCITASLTLDASASDSGPPFSFAWSAQAGGQFGAGTNTLTPAVAAGGLYQLLIINENTGCRDSAAVLVRDSSVQLSAAIGPADTLTCDSSQVTLDAAASSSGPNIVYEWFTTDGNIVGGSTGVNITVDISGTYRLVVRDTMAFCADTTEVFVPVDTLPPAVSAQVNAELNCTVTEVVLNGAGSDAGPGFSYRWDGPCVIAGQDSIAAVADCPGMYFLQVENTDNGCAAIDSVEVAQDENAPAASVGGPYTLTCDSLQLTLNGSGSGMGPDFTYSWTGPGITSGATSLYPAINLPGQYTLTVRDTVNTCLSTATATVEIDTVAPIAEAGEIDVITCDSSIVAIGGFETSMGPGFSYLWTTDDGQFAGPVNGPFVRVSRPGVYQLSVRNIANGCASVSSTTVFIDDQPPNVEAGPDQELNCAAPQALLDGSASDVGAFLHYEWSGPCLIYPADTSRMLVDCPGIYYLSVANAASGCVGVDTVVVSRDSLLPIAVLPDSLELSCLDGTALIDASASEGASFQWFFEGQPAGFSTLMPVVDSVGIYTLVAANAAQDCADTASVAVLLDCTPDILIAAPDTLTCAVTSVTIDATASTSGDSITYQWAEPGPSCIVSGQGTPELEVRCSGLYTLVVTNTVVGLSDTASVEVIANDTPPLAEAGPSDTLTCDEPTAILNAAGSTQGTGIGYSWTKLDDDFFEASGLTAEVNDAGTYFLTVIDSLTGCVDEDIVVIGRSADLPDVGFGSQVIPCLQDTFWLQAFVDPPGQPYVFSWAGDNVIGSTDSSAVLVDTTGVLTLTVTNTSNDCSTFREVEVFEQSCIPCVEIGPLDSLTCRVDTVVIEASFCEPCIGCALQWSTQGGLILSNTDSLRVLAGAPGAYTLTATDTLGFSRVLTVRVVENTSPPPADAGPDQVLDCDTPEVLLGGGAPDPRLSYQWLDGNGAPTGQDTLPSLAVSTPGTYQLQVTDRITGCQAASQAAVTIDTLRPEADAGPPVTLTCDMPSRILDGSGSDFGPEITYSWSGPAGTSIGGTNSFNPTVSDTGWFLLTVTDTTTGCFSRDSVLVTRDGELPPVPMLSDTNLTCGVSVILLIGELPPQPGFSAQWCRLDANGQPQGPCTNDLFVDVSNPGTYRFEVRNDSTGCTNSATIVVGEDYAPPTADAGPDGILLCSVDSLQLQGGGGPPGAALAYNWTAVGGSPIVGADSPTPVVFQPDTFLLVVTNLANQCTASDTVAVSQDINAPAADAGPDTSLTCTRVNVRLQGQGMTASGNMQVRWTTPDGNIALDGATLTPLADAPGLYILQVTDPQNGCTSTDTAAVVADRQPPTAILDSSTLQLDCRTDSVRLNAGASTSASGAGVAFDWRQVPFGSIGTGPQITLGNTGNYRLVVADLGNGCKDTLAFTIRSDYEQPDAAIAPPLLITCLRPSVPLNGASSSAGPEFSYIWAGPAGDTLPETGPQAAAGAPGTYQLTVVDEGNGCFATARRTVVPTPSPAVSIREPEPLDCDVRTVRLDGSASSFGDFITYAWTTDVGGQLAAPADSNRTIAAAPGWYTLLVTDLRNGCTAADSVLAIELASPVDSLLARPFPPSCPGRVDGYIEVDTVLGGTGPFLYAIEGGSFSGLTQFEGLPPGSYQLSVQDANGCEAETTIDIPEAENIQVDLGQDFVTLRLGGTDTLVAEVSPSNYDTIWWWPYDSLSPLNSPVQVVNPEKTTTYFVWVSNGAGCTATDNIEVRVVREYPVYAPNAFSPNGDDNNDGFTLYAGDDVVNIRIFQIFDRWGDLVFESANFQPNDPNLGWDGTLDGMPMDPAVFVFYAEVEFTDGRTEVVRGDLVLMR
ncbi:MAG: gliding motility-associated C-terminal domain-containing protein [Lewinellaceae bacterium]|nr:gliding motility-associated C-terminal domain-containing protein [Lewinellaceae bacterium]